MRVIIDRRDSRITHYNFDSELVEKIERTLLIDCNGLLVTMYIGDIIYLYLINRGVDFNTIVMEEYDDERYLIYVDYVRCVSRTSYLE